MNKPKCDDLDYIHFLIATQKSSPALRQLVVNLKLKMPQPHDAFTRLLQRQPLDTKPLWQEAKAFREGRSFPAIGFP